MARFTKSARLLKASDYRRVFEKPVRSGDRFFTVLARPNGLEQARLGLAISKKKARRAIDRNRLKRLARESFRNHDDIFLADYVVMANPDSVTTDNSRLNDSLNSHWQRLTKKCAKFS